MKLEHKRRDPIAIGSGVIITLHIWEELMNGKSLEASFLESEDMMDGYDNIVKGANEFYDQIQLHTTQLFWETLILKSMENMMDSHREKFVNKILKLYNE